jgi:hypothetical protein
MERIPGRHTPGVSPEKPGDEDHSLVQEAARRELLQRQSIQHDRNVRRIRRRLISKSSVISSTSNPTDVFVLPTLRDDQLPVPEYVFPAIVTSPSKSVKRSTSPFVAVIVKSSQYIISSKWTGLASPRNVDDQLWQGLRWIDPSGGVQPNSKQPKKPSTIAIPMSCRCLNRSAKLSRVSP